MLSKHFEKYGDTSDVFVIDKRKEYHVVVRVVSDKIPKLYIVLFYEEKATGEYYNLCTMEMDTLLFYTDIDRIAEEKLITLLRMLAEALLNYAEWTEKIYGELLKEEIEGMKDEDIAKFLKASLDKILDRYGKDALQCLLSYANGDIIKAMRFVIKYFYRAIGWYGLSEDEIEEMVKDYGEYED